MRRRSKGQYTRTRWLSPVTAGENVGAAGSFVAPVYGATVPILNLINQTDLINYQGRLKVLRIVGNIIVRNESLVSPQYCTWAIKQVTASSVGGLPAYNLSLTEQLAMSWWFMRFHLLTPSTAIAGDAIGSTNKFEAPFGTYIDLRPRRILREQDCLSLYAQSTGGQVDLTPNLRILVQF